MIETELGRKLADELLFGRLAKGGEVTIDIAGDKLTFTWGRKRAGD